MLNFRYIGLSFMRLAPQLITSGFAGALLIIVLALIGDASGLGFNAHFLLCAIIPIKIYCNVDVDKLRVLSDNKGKCGIYLFTNLINGKQYVGSSYNLNRRFSEYFNGNYLLRNKCMAICRALLKHGYSNFSLTIIEYCEASKCLEREGYYTKKLNPEYNIAKEPGAPMSGRNHSPESIKSMSDTHKKIDHFGRFKTGENHPNFGKPKPAGAGSPSQQIEVTDLEEKTSTTYISIHEAAAALNIRIQAISNYINRNQKTPYKGKYIFKRK